MTGCHILWKGGDGVPLDTFFRLPEEKRARLLDAAWEEFSTVGYSDVSINKIILRARIPRGSFYQYFADKEDLFGYLVEEVKSRLVKISEWVMEQEGQDIFSAALLVFDELMEKESLAHPDLMRCIEVVKINPGLGPSLFCGKGEGLFWNAFLEQNDLSVFRSQEREFLEQTFMMLTTSLGYALVESLTRPEEKEAQRRMLRIRLDIIRSGSLRQGAAGPV